jgi:hypothetical protein
LVIAGLDQAKRPQPAHLLKVPVAISCSTSSRAEQVRGHGRVPRATYPRRVQLKGFGTTLCTNRAPPPAVLLPCARRCVWPCPCVPRRAEPWHPRARPGPRCPNTHAAICARRPSHGRCLGRRGLCCECLQARLATTKLPRHSSLPAMNIAELMKLGVRLDALSSG